MTPENLASTEFNRAPKEFHKLFPSLELCQRAQKLGFPETRFRWTKKSPNAKWEITINPNFLSPLEHLTNHEQKAVLVKFREECTAPAPTLQEVLDRLPKYTYVSRDGAAYIVSAPPDKPDCDGYTALDDTFNAANAALELWCELEERKASDGH